MTLQASGAIKGPGSLPFWRKSAVAAALLLAMGFTALDAQALALGRVNVQSALGEPLRAEIDVPDINPDEAASLKAAVAGPDAFKAAGLEYNAALSNVQISLQKRPDGRSYLRLTSDRPMTEPFVDLILEASWAAGRMVRDYTMLFDPPNLRVMPAPAAITAPIISSGAPRSVVTPSGVTPRPTATAPAPVYITEEAAPAPKRSSPASPRAARAPRAERVEIAAPSAGEIVVKKGNTAAQLAMRYKPAGVSLDQMLVSMLSTNPDAFVNGNVNRLKAGVVLDLPSAAATAESTSRTAARQVIVAQSKDFNEFRRRLAQGAPGTAAPTASRKATGTVQAKVEESKANTTSPDKLTLSKAAAAAKGVKEEIIAKEKQAKDAAARTAELTKNLQDLTRLGATTTTATAKPAAALASAAATGAKNTGAGAAVGALNLPEPASASAAVKAAATASSAAASPVPAVASATPASSAVAVPAPVSSAAVAPAASVASVAKASTVTAAPTAPAAPVPQAGASAAKPGAPATPPAPPVAEASLVDSLLSNPVTLPAAGGLLALLGGFGAWRWRQRKKNEQKDSSFLESRLQPDSFFGASGGQRIDTNNSVANSAAVPGGSSSMVYSPSQLDAAGDVDPVAEADVYLAYGRDLQAEEILKEALRMQPTRIAVHAKLLEIYAKRRDTKAFESLAKEAYRVSNGQGPEWESARALGRELDPNNNLYQGGDLPRASAQASPAGKIGSLAGAGVLAAGTAAASAVSTAGKSVPVPDANAEVDFDLNLDFDPAPATIAKPTPDPYLSAPASLPPARIARGNQGGDPHFQAPEEDSHHTTAMELRSEVDDPLDFGFDAPALPIIASGPRDTVKLSGADMDSFSNSLSFSAKPPVKTPSTSTAPMAMNTNPVNATNPLEFDFGNLSLDLPKTNTDITSAVAASAAVDAGITGDPLETKLALAQEFREIGDFDGARAMAEEVFAEAKGPLKARAQRMVADLS